MRHANGEYRTIDWNGADLLDDPSVNGYVLNGGDVTEARQAAEDLVAARDAALVASKTKSRIRLDDEPRDPHADERRHRAHRAPPPDRPRRRAARACLRREGLGREPAGHHQRHLGLLEDRGRQARDRGVSAQCAERDRRRRAHPGRQPHTGRASSSWSTSTPDVPPALLGDGTRIRQVLLNFGANAVKFTSEGEVVIRVRVLHQNSERVALHFDVVDTGIGHRPGGPGAPLQRLRPGGLLDHPTVRRHRARPDHQPAVGGAHGREARARPAPRARGRRSGSSCRFAAPKMHRHSTDGDPRTLSGQRALVVDDNATNRQDPAPAAALLGRRGCRGGGRLPGARARAHRGAGRPGIRSRRGRPQHARHGRHRAGPGAEDRPRDRGDRALLAELLGPPARARRVPPDRVRRQPDQAGSVVGAVRLPDHQPQRRVRRRRDPGDSADRPVRDLRRSWG